MLVRIHMLFKQPHITHTGNVFERASLRVVLPCCWHVLLSLICPFSIIQGMVERLCESYGMQLSPHIINNPQVDKQHSSRRSRKQLRLEGQEDVKRTFGHSPGECSGPFYAFPTLEQLAVATEDELRSNGFGYRAKFITGTVAALSAKPGGGAQWLQSLRKVSYEEASEELCTLPGIGPKVAACVCLFSLDKHEAIPVDTHVWQVAVRYYTPELKGKSLTKRVSQKIEETMKERFGAYAGWAHNILFISELSSHNGYLPEHLRSQQKVSKKTAKGNKV